MKCILVFISFFFILLLSPLSVVAEKTENVIPPDSAGTHEINTSSQVSNKNAPNLSRPGPVKQKSPYPEENKDLPPSFPSKKENFIILNFDNAALKDVVNTISSITKENFIVGPGLDARVTVHSATRIPVSEALNVFESVLEANGMALVRSGSYYKIVSGTSTKKKPVEIRRGREVKSIPDTDRPVTVIIPVNYVPVREISTVLQPMLTQFGIIIPNPRNNLLIVTDLSSNIRRFLTILEEIDVDAFQDTRMGIFQPRYSDVKTLSDELTDILNALNLGSEGTISLVPIERINSLVVFSSNSYLHKIVEDWIKKLDEVVTTGQNLFVYPVQNVKADAIANILKTIYMSEGVTTRKNPAAKISPRKRTGIQRSQTASQQQSAARVEIVTFEPTNSLVILASPGIYREMKDTISKLDIYPLEVLIEVIIAEVSLTDSDQFGIQWSVLNSVHIEGDKGFTQLVQSRSSDTPSASTPLTLGSGTASTSLTAGGFSYLLFKPDRLLAMIHALASKGRVDILSSPRLLVRNHEEAYIEVGEDIPTATSSTQTAVTTTSTLTQNIEYKTVGIKLKIKPSINDEKTVVLDIEQEVSDQLPNVTVGQEGFSYPSFSTRKTKTSVIVPDKQAIVIGGIMKTKKDSNRQGIPLLSSIPILGNLFRYTTNQRSKTELIIILTPHVISNKTEADVLTTEFLDKLKEVKSFLEHHESRVIINAPDENKSRPGK